MNRSFQVQVVRHGKIKLPKKLREENNIKEGDILTLTDLGDGIAVMSRHQSRVDEISNELAKELKDSGETPESMLTTLREVRMENSTKKA